MRRIYRRHRLSALLTFVHKIPLPRNINWGIYSSECHWGCFLWSVTASSSSVIVEPLCHVFQKSLLTGYVSCIASVRKIMYSILVSTSSGRRLDVLVFCVYGYYTCVIERQLCSSLRWLPDQPCGHILQSRSWPHTYDIHMYSWRYHARSHR